MMIRLLRAAFFFTFICIDDVRSFAFSPPTASILRSLSSIHASFICCSSRYMSSSATNEASSSSGANRQKRMGELTPSEQALYDFLCELSQSKYSFRVVVVGKNGSAILESTIPSLGPVIKITQSPSTGTLRCAALCPWFTSVSQVVFLKVPIWRRLLMKISRLSITCNLNRFRKSC
jgi:hypothetical protein